MSGCSSPARYCFSRVRSPSIVCSPACSWRAAFTAIAANSDTLTAEMGERAVAAAVTEALLTLQVRPCSRRILAVASRPG